MLGIIILLKPENDAKPKKNTRILNTVAFVLSVIAFIIAVLPFVVRIFLDIGLVLLDNFD